MGSIHSVGPNQAVVISGGCCAARGSRIVVGGYSWVWWCVSDVKKISLALMTIKPACQNILTAEGVPVSVTAVAQVKVMRDMDFLRMAV